jgi:sulfite exporter TauE/SafE
MHAEGGAMRVVCYILLGVTVIMLEVSTFEQFQWKQNIFAGIFFFVVGILFLQKAGIFLDRNSQISVER